MTINSITGGDIAASVWAAAARSLTVDPATDAGAAALVWGHAARTLTADPTISTYINLSSSIGAGATADMRAAANKRRFITVYPLTAANAWTASLWVGAAQATFATMDAMQTVVFASANGDGIQVKNNNAGAATINVNGVESI